MATKKRGLGRGLDALLSGSVALEPDDGEPVTLRSLPVEQIRRGRYQPRERIDSQALTELADSIRAQGVVQPIVVRPVGDQSYEIIAGERRWRAAQMAELREVPCVVREVPDRAAMAIALIENIQREDLHTLEEARALERLKEEFSLTHQEVADAVGRSRVAVTNLLRLMELNQDVIALLEENRLEMGHARALLGLKGEDQSQAARHVVDRRLSVRQTEALVRKWSEHKPTERRPPRRPDPDIERLRADLSERLGTRVTIEDKGGRGRLTINYHSLDQLDGILSRIK